MGSNIARLETLDSKKELGTWTEVHKLKIREETTCWRDSEKAGGRSRERTMKP